MVSVFKNVGERSTAKNYSSVSLLSEVSKDFSKLVNNRISDHLQKRGFFSDFQYGFKYSRSTSDFLTVLSDRIVRSFNISGATRQGLAYWYSSQTYILWNFRSGIWLYFYFFQ